MIDIATIHSPELIQNLNDPKSRDCFFGLLNHTLSRMCARLLRNNIPQPLTDPTTLELRYEALEELTTREEMFFALRQGTAETEEERLYLLTRIPAVENFVDVDRLLTSVRVHLDARQLRLIRRITADCDSRGAKSCHDGARHQPRHRAQTVYCIDCAYS